MLTATERSPSPVANVPVAGTSDSVVTLAAEAARPKNALLRALHARTTARTTDRFPLFICSSIFLSQPGPVRHEHTSQKPRAVPEISWCPSVRQRDPARSRIPDDAQSQALAQEPERKEGAALDDHGNDLPVGSVDGDLLAIHHRDALADPQLHRLVAQLDRDLARRGAPSDRPAQGFDERADRQECAAVLDHGSHLARRVYGDLPAIHGHRRLTNDEHDGHRWSGSTGYREQARTCCGKNVDIVIVAHELRGAIKADLCRTGSPGAEGDGDDPAGTAAEARGRDATCDADTARRVVEALLDHDGKEAAGCGVDTGDFQYCGREREVGFDGIDDLATRVHEDRNMKRLADTTGACLLVKPERSASCRTDGSPLADQGTAQREGECAGKSNDDVQSAPGAATRTLHSATAFSSECRQSLSPVHSDIIRLRSTTSTFRLLSRSATSRGTWPVPVPCVLRHWAMRTLASELLTTSALSGTIVPLPPLMLPRRNRLTTMVVGSVILVNTRSWPCP